MATNAPIGSVVMYDSTKHGKLVAYMAALHASCITSDKTISTFVPPINIERLLKWWHARIQEMSQGKRVIFLLLETNTNTAEPGKSLLGMVMLSLFPGFPMETDTFRANVETLLVAPKYRERGCAMMLLRELEAEALRRGKTLLVLDTMTNTPSINYFMKRGFSLAGNIPSFGLGPEGRPQDATILYKHIRPSAAQIADFIRPSST